MDAKNLNAKLTYFQNKMRQINKDLDDCPTGALYKGDQKTIDLMIDGAKVMGAIELLHDLLDELLHESFNEHYRHP